MGRARRLSRQKGKTAHVFGETRYAAGSWQGRRRRVLIKAEVVRLEGRTPKDNARFVVTNLKGSPRHLYKKVYCGRGQVENRIKELHHGLEIDRTSCTSFLANQLRVLITAAAYVLMQELRLLARRGTCARAQVSTLRERLIKVGVWLERSVRRVVLHLPARSRTSPTGCVRSLRRRRSCIAAMPEDHNIRSPHRGKPTELSYRNNCWHKETVMHIKRFRKSPFNTSCVLPRRPTRSCPLLQGILAAFTNGAG